ncbi:S8 family serine peptidase [Prosthecobacter sp. SYSU 5D2]|uniref:S8 family serine peptidase n=1 Tax=Prosthecobacter sp. SYSU 5D2 TaxID=3134134 RepID=UPI0031FF2518
MKDSTQRLLAATVLVLLSIGAWQMWRPLAAESEPEQKQPLQTFSPPPRLAIPPLMKAEKGLVTLETPPQKQDKYAGRDIIAQKETEEVLQGVRQVKRVRLVRDPSFKYPIIRVEDELVRGPEGDRLIRQIAMVGDHVLVKPADASIREEDLLSLLKDTGATVRKKMHASGTWLIAFPRPDLDTVPEMVTRLSELKKILRYAEPDFIMSANVLPNDASFSNLWGMHNTGANNGVEDADIDAPEAWDLTTGSRSVRVAVIDSGIDHTHPDLQANMWTNPHEIPGNGIDDDGNGFIDDVRGWNFVSDNASPQDDNSHGTHCAGTIGALGNNGSGVAGVCWQVSLVAVKFLDASGNGPNSDAVEAVSYATSIGVNLTSNSYSGSAYSQAMVEAIDEARDAGILFITVAGNNGSYVEFYPEYPGNYANTNLISVAATTREDGLADFSNYGDISTDLAAPGQDIYSTIPGGGYGYKSGTSMACPHVAGACALLMAHRPALTHQNIRELILKSADSLPALTGKTVTGSRLNLFNALMAADDILVTPGTGFIATGPFVGPFSPASKTYLVSNDTQTSATWTASSDRPWVTAFPLSGSLSAGESMNLTLTLNEQAEILPAGTHIAKLTVTNPATGRSQIRNIALQVNSMPIYVFDLETDPGWPRDGEWDYGTPQGGGGNSYGRADPKTAASGSNVFGINLAGDYSTQVGQPQHLTAGPFDFTGHRNVLLRFHRWLNSDYPSWVWATVEVSNNGNDWHQVWNNHGAPSGESAWTQVGYDISAYADGQPEVYIRWGHHVASSGAYPYSGWNIDDIQLLGSPLEQMTLELPESLTEGGSPAQARVTISPAPTENLTIALSSNRPGEELTLPASVIIATGQEEATFDLTPLQDALADGSQTVTITATAPGYPPASKNIQVHDDEQAQLTLHLPASLQEGSGEIFNQASISLPAPAAADILISLLSSDVTELLVPASITLPQGQQSVSLPLTVPDDVIIDGQQTVTVTATVTNWPVAQASLTIADNEPLHLTVTLPDKRLESAGLLPEAGTVSTSGILAAPLTVSLLSSDSSELTVAASLVIPAGSSTAGFDLQLVDDDVSDGDQTIQVTVSSPGFTEGAALIVVADDEAPALPVLPVPANGQNPVHPGSSLSWQYDPHSGGIPESYEIYFGTAPSPQELLGVSDEPLWALPLPGLSSATTYYWRVVARRGSASRPGPVWSFTTPEVGALHHFMWDSTPPAVALGVPFPVRVTAVDEHDFALERYDLRTPLSAQLSQPETVTGTGSYPWQYPLATNYHDARSQSIYTPAEIGPAGRLTALAIEVSKPPGQSLSGFTVRLRHTSKTDYLSGGLTWESEDWTTVYAADQTLSAYGWTWFVFTTPFDYDGSSNLMVDFSYNNSSFSTNGATRTTIISNYRTLAFRSDSTYGDPLTWSGGYPDALAYNGLPNLRLQRADIAVPLTPEISGTYAHASWTGQITLHGTGDGIRLKAHDPVTPSIHGLSAPLKVVEVEDFILDPEPPFTGGSTNQITGQPLGDGYTYEIQRATQGDFSDAASSGFVASPAHLFTNLTDGQLYHYRGRARTGGARGNWSAVERSTQDATPPAITFTQATGNLTALASVDLAGTGTDQVSGISSIRVNDIISIAEDSFAAWSTSALPLMEGINTFTVTATDKAIPPNVSQATWVITRISQPEADGDHNGMSSLLEYAFHTNGSALGEKWPFISAEKHPTTDATHLILSYHRLIHNPAGLTYSVETSPDMDDWQPLDAPPEVLSATPAADGMTELVKVRIHPAIHLHPRRFARVRVINPAE